jgi:F0F1-type ATP synthase membrane subunit b/b'
MSNEFDSTFMPRSECEKVEEARQDKLELIHESVKEVAAEIKSKVLPAIERLENWQNQFKGGLRVVVWIIGSIAAFGALYELIKELFTKKIGG